MSSRSDPTPVPSGGLPELELDLPAAPSPKVKSRQPPQADGPLELAVDPRALVQERTPVVAPPPPLRGLATAPTSALSPAPAPAAASFPTPAPLAAAPDIAFDAQLLADYGELPRHWLLSPLYAYRVLKRRRELKRVLSGRRAEAVRTAEEAEDALVAFAERSRSVAESAPLYAPSLEALRHAEELLRSRDRVLAAEQDAQDARLAQVDARLSALEGGLGRAQDDEQAILKQLADSQTTLGREEARLKRAESELRAAQQRAGGAGGGRG